jgi:N-acetylglucosamine kinase-like BadF-type ATPase
MTHILIRDNEEYTLVTSKGQVQLKAEDINEYINKASIIDNLKSMSVSLSRAIEDGDNLSIGIVIGQVLSNINQIINEVN